MAQRHKWHHQALRLALLAWVFVVSLVLVVAVDPKAAVANPMQLHGALQRDSGVGIISHRGAAAIAPENTLSAVRIALDQGVDFVEVDLRLTVDGVPVLMHDSSVSRTTNGRGAVARYTLAELQELDAGSWFSAEYEGERVPTLEELIAELLPTQGGALLELKDDWTTDQVRPVVNLLRSHHLVNRVVLQSFNTVTLEALHEIGPEFASVLLTRELDAETVELAAELSASGVGARLSRFDSAPEAVVALQSLGIGTFVYTLNDEKRWREAATLGIDLIVTDDPLALAHWRAG